MKTGFSVLVAVWLCTSVIAVAGARKSVTSELQRGFALSSSCALSGGADIGRFGDCIQHAVDEQNKLATASDGFLLGLYFWAAANAEELNREAPSDGAKATAHAYAAETDAGEKKLKQTDKKLVALFHLAPSTIALVEAARAE